MTLLQHLLQNLENVLIVVSHLYLNSPHADALSESALGVPSADVWHTPCALGLSVPSGEQWAHGEGVSAQATGRMLWLLFVTPGTDRSFSAQLRTRAGRVPGFPGGFPQYPQCKG